MTNLTVTPVKPSFTMPAKAVFGFQALCAARIDNFGHQGNQPLIWQNYINLH